jgi:TrmH family RNA methyltransferase
MITKNKIAEIKKLHQKKFRDETGCFIVEGTKSVLEVLESELVIKDFLATENWKNRFLTPKKQLQKVEIVSEKELERISTLQTPQEVLIIVEKPRFTISELDNNLPILALDDIRDPGNLGTIIRTADWFGFSQIVCSLRTVEYTNPKAIQASMGSFIRAKIIYADLTEICTQMKGKRKIFGSFLSGTSSNKAKFSSNDMIIIGNESTGISPSLSSLIDESLYIAAAKSSKAESLNAAIATAILLYQFQLSQN